MALTKASTRPGRHGNATTVAGAVSATVAPVVKKSSNKNGVMMLSVDDLDATRARCLGCLYTVVEELELLPLSCPEVLGTRLSVLVDSLEAALSYVHEMRSQIGGGNGTR